MFSRDTRPQSLKSFYDLRKTTMVKLVQKIDSIILIDPSNKTVMTGKLSGQFFTNAAMKGVMLDFIQPKVFEDPAMGTPWARHGHAMSTP
jgi:hypothetical protein